MILLWARTPTGRIPHQSPPRSLLLPPNFSSSTLTRQKRKPPLSKFERQSPPFSFFFPSQTTHPTHSFVTIPKIHIFPTPPSPPPPPSISTSYLHTYPIPSQYHILIHPSSIHPSTIPSLPPSHQTKPTHQPNPTQPTQRAPLFPLA